MCPCANQSNSQNSDCKIDIKLSVQTMIVIMMIVNAQPLGVIAIIIDGSSINSTAKITETAQ